MPIESGYNIEDSGITPEAIQPVETNQPVVGLSPRAILNAEAPLSIRQPLDVVFSEGRSPTRNLLDNVFTEDVDLGGETASAEPEVISSEPLPPTPITAEARERFSSWGVSEADVARLQEYGSLMRYDRVPEKAVEIAERGGEIVQDTTGTEKVVLPGFYNYKYGFSGECSSLTEQMGGVLNSSGFLSEVNEKLVSQGNPRLQLAVVTGQSPTHFNEDDAQHTWLGILPERARVDDRVDVDTSFQEISTPDTNGYTVKFIEELTIDPQAEETAPAEVAVVPHNRYNPVEILQKNLSSVATLGISSDKAAVYTLGFYRDVTTSEVNPVIAATLSDLAKGPVCIRGLTGDIEFSSGHLLTDRQWAEMRTVLTNVERMQLTRIHTSIQA